VGDVRFNQFALRASIDSYDLTVFPDGRAIIKGTTDIGLARSLYARYVAKLFTLSQHPTSFRTNLPDDS